MGYPKYLEDNYEAFCERMALKNDSWDYIINRYNTSAKKTIANSKEETAFSEMFTGESCFSF